MKKYLKQISLLAAAVLPCACMVGPDYEKPDNSEFVDFEKFANENGLWKNAAPRDTAARGDWWRYSATRSFPNTCANAPKATPI